MYGSVCVSDSRMSDWQPASRASGSGSAAGASSALSPSRVVAKSTSGGCALMNGMIGRLKYLWRFEPETTFWIGWSSRIVRDAATALASAAEIEDDGPPDRYKPSEEVKVIVLEPMA